MNFLRAFLGQVASLTGPIGRTVRVRWLRTLIWCLAAAVTVWLYGDMLRLGRLAPFGTPWARLLAVVLLLLGWAVYNVVQAVRDRRRNKAMIAALTAEQGGDRGNLPAQEVEQIRQRLQEAMSQLRKVSGGRRDYVYRLPWYIVIGPPGSGKTTALLNSGLYLPLAESLGEEPVRGVGGTRNCDWWFTEDAILLDAAGRYTTQDSDPELDRKGWQGFLDLLKQYRPLQPINGVIVALSLEDLVARDPHDRLQHAQAIRRRLVELTEFFGTRFPVYLVLTKVDLLAGFVEFFDAFSRIDREQPWGITFPLDDGRQGTTPAIAHFGTEFDLLLRRLNDLLLERMQQETDVERRGLIYGFPVQMATLKQVIGETLAEVFTTSRFEKRPLLRGVYFASSTQGGVPIDRMMHAMGAVLGVEVPRQPMFSGSRKSYFLTRLLRSVVFAEANLAAADPRARRRLRNTRNVALGTGVALLLLMGVVWGTAFTENRRLVSTADRQVTLYDREMASLGNGPVADDDFRKVVPPLDILRDGPGNLRARSAAFWLHGGLDQTAKLTSQYDAAYDRALNGLLLPRVLVFLQKQIRARQTDPAFLVGAMRVYLGLGGQGPLDPAFAHSWMTAEWRARYPGAADDRLRHDLDGHFAALLGSRLAPVALDAAAISTARAELTRQPAASRVYAAMRDDETAARLPAWTVLGKAGALADRVFVRRSGAPLGNGIPGFFTRDGYLNVFLPRLHQAVRGVRREGWIYGDTGDGGNDSEDAIATQVTQLYRNDFTTQWMGLLSDLRVVAPVGLGTAVGVLNGLTGPDSVLRRLLLAVAADSDLRTPPPSKDPQAQRIAQLVTSAPGSAVADAPGSDPLGALHDMTVGQNGQPAQLDDLLKTLDALYQQVSRANGALPQASSLLQAAGGVDDADQTLISQARQLPDPVDNWMLALATDVRSLSSGSAQSQISQLWQNNGARFCRQAVSGRYPFVPNAVQEISLDDFSKLFATGGVLDSFFSQNLRQFANTARHPWQWQYSAAAGVRSASLASFERADAIRQAFFGTSGTQAGFNFSVTPRSLDNGSNGVILDFQGQTLSYAHGPLRPQTMHWPGAADAGSRIAFQPRPGETRSETGVWSPFRLLESGYLSSGGGDDFQATFRIGLAAASFDIHVDSVLNPMNLRLLRSFRCPANL